MSVPALRQPRQQSDLKDNGAAKKSLKIFHSDVQYVIVTLKDARKLVVPSDSYHGVITAGENYKCVFCQNLMELDSRYKEEHKISNGHKQMLEKMPHVAEYGENLIREVNKNTSFCTICNVVIPNVNLMGHLRTDVHTYELEKAVIRADTYKPF